MGHTNSLAVALVGYSVCGGVGAGLVYATCIGTAARWYPERSTAIVGLVGGAFAFGAVPFLVLAYTVVDVTNHTMLLDGAGIVALVVVTACGALLRDPPAHWWPAHIDPRVWALDKRVNRGLAKNRPALRRYSPGEVVHNGTFAAMYGLLALAAAVSLFDIVYLAVLAAGNGLSRTAVATAFGLLVGMNGGGRAIVGWLSDRVVRSRALAAALIVGGLAQFGLLFGGQHGWPVLVIVAAGLAGLGTGCCYPLLVAIVREYFGEDAALQNFGIAYSAKAIGSVAGTGLAALAVSVHGHAVTLFTVAVLGLAGAVVARLLDQPGRPAMLLPGVGTRHRGARSRDAATVAGYGRVDTWDV
jgi:MFS family permease